MANDVLPLRKALEATLAVLLTVPLSRHHQPLQRKALLKTTFVERFLRQAISIAEFLLTFHFLLTRDPPLAGIFNTPLTHAETSLLDSSTMDALYYPFHLCHEQTLQQLLKDYPIVHFRDFMALQLTPFMGTTAFPDRMGDDYPDLLANGRIVQGHDVSGRLSPEIATAVNRDVTDPHWRSIFHEGLRHDRSFQRGLVAFSQDSQGRISVPTDPALLVAFQRPEREFAPYTVETLQAMSQRRLPEHENLTFEYGFGLIKTSAALVYSIQLCHQLGLVAVTDSPSHHQLLARTCLRDSLELSNICVKREGY